MDEETIYTDEQVQDIAEKLAGELRGASSIIIDCLVNKSEEYRRGPFGILSLWSNRFNPLGRFPVEAEALTGKQKAIITRIVGKAMAQLGIDHPDYENDRREFQERLIADSRRCPRGVERDWDLEQRLKAARNDPDLYKP